MASRLESPFVYAERILTLYPSGDLDVLKKDLIKKYPNCTPEQLHTALWDAAVVVSVEQDKQGYNPFKHAKKFITEHERHLATKEVI